MEKIDFQKIGRFLPSKRFAIVIGSVAGGLLLLLLITSYFGSHAIFNSHGNKNMPISETDTVEGVVTRDSNGNSIPDWEETLWGLDPRADGTANKNTIAEKRQASGITATENTTPQNPTDVFSRQLLSTILALQQSGSLTTQAIANLASSVGGSVDAQHAEVTLYTMNNMHLAPTNGPSAKATYATALKKIVDQYANTDMGAELSIIAAGLEGGGAETLATLLPVADAYEDAAKKIIALPTPSSATGYALALANTSLQISADLRQVAGLYDNVLAGMVGIDDYIKASADSDKASAGMRAYINS